MALNTASLKSSLSTYLDVFAKRPEMSTETLNHHNSIVRKVAAAVDAFETQEQGILRDRVLSDQGKQEKLAALATDTAPKFAFLEVVVSREDQARRTAEEIMFRVKVPPAAGTDPQVQYWYGKEIREQVRTRTAQARDQRQAADVEFVRACEASELELGKDDVQAQPHRDAVLWSLLQTPGGPGVTPEIFQRAMTERGRHLRPAAFAAYQQAGALYDSLSTLRDSLVGWLRGLGGDQKKIFDALGGPEPTTAQTTQRMVAA